MAVVITDIAEIACEAGRAVTDERIDEIFAGTAVSTGRRIALININRTTLALETRSTHAPKNVNMTFYAFFYAFSAPSDI